MVRTMICDWCGEEEDEEVMTWVHSEGWLCPDCLEKYEDYEDEEVGYE